MKRGIKGQKIVAATHNQGKLEEIAALLGPLNVEIISAKALNLPEPEDSIVEKRRLPLKSLQTYSMRRKSRLCLRSKQK